MYKLWYETFGMIFFVLIWSATRMVFNISNFTTYGLKLVSFLTDNGKLFPIVMIQKWQYRVGNLSIWWFQASKSGVLVFVWHFCIWTLVRNHRSVFWTCHHGSSMTCGAFGTNESCHIPAKNASKIRSMCLELQFSQPRWRWVSAATIASDRYVWSC